MTYIFGLIILTFFAVIGLAGFITAVMRGCGSDDKLKLVLSELTAGTAEARVRRAVSICEDIRCEHLICECADNEAARICEKLRDDHGIISIITI